MSQWCWGVKVGCSTPSGLLSPASVCNLRGNVYSESLVSEGETSKCWEPRSRGWERAGCDEGKKFIMTKNESKSSVVSRNWLLSPVPWVTEISCDLSCRSDHSILSTEAIWAFLITLLLTQNATHGNLEFSVFVCLLTLVGWLGWIFSSLFL